MPTYVSCAGKACGEPCALCPPDDPSCVETTDLKVCHADGTCSSSSPACNPSNYDPCAGKVCGDSCTVCPPDDADCVEAAVMKQCDLEGKRRMSEVECK